MSITHNWTIANTERTLADGGVTVAHWRCTSSDGEHSASSYGTCGFTPDADDPTFVAYNALTEEIVLGWVWANGVDQEQIEAANEAKIDALVNPTSASGVPWA